MQDQHFATQSLVENTFIFELMSENTKDSSDDTPNTSFCLYLCMIWSFAVIIALAHSTVQSGSPSQVGCPQEGDGWFHTDAGPEEILQHLQRGGWIGMLSLQEMPGAQLLVKLTTNTS